MRVNKVKRINNIIYSDSMKRLEIDDNYNLINFAKCQNYTTYKYSK